MTLRLSATLFILFLVLQAIGLSATGHPLICKCGFVTLWANDVFSSQNSQQIADWYTFGHINHGILFYAGVALMSAGASFNFRAIAVSFTGLLWEVIENTNVIIERFREVTMSLDYYGDSVINSVFDSIFMLGGVILARRVPLWASAVWVLGSEALTTSIVRDGLALNTLMLIYPIEAVKAWQMAGWTG